MILSKSKKGCLIPLGFLAIEVLIMAALEYVVAIRLAVLQKLLAEADRACLLLVKNLLDLRLVHIDVREVQVLTCVGS